MLVADKQQESYVLERIYQSVKSARGFRYSHHSSDISVSLYSDLGTQARQTLMALKSWNPLPIRYPANLMYYRAAFHQQLATDTDFLHALSLKDINTDQYFAQVEVALRLTLRVAMRSSYRVAAARAGLLLNTARHYAPKVKYQIFRGKEMADIIASLVEANPKNKEFLREVKQTELAVELGAHYVCGLLNSDFEYTYLILNDAAKFNLPHAPHYYNFVFEAGVLIGEKLATAMLELQPKLHLRPLESLHVMADAVYAIAEKQAAAGLAKARSGARLTRLLTENAAPHIASIIAAWPEQFKEGKRQVSTIIHSGTIRELHKRRRKIAEPQDRAPASMHAGQVPAKPVTENTGKPSSDAEQRDQNQAAAMQAALSQAKSAEPKPLSKETSAVVVDAGKTIIEYLRNMKLEMQDMEQEKGVASQGSAADDEDYDEEDDEKEREFSGRKVDGQQEEDQEFVVSVAGKPKKPMKMSQIISVLKHGQQVTFSNRQEMKSFLKAAPRSQKTGARPFRMSQVKYTPKPQRSSSKTREKERSTRRRRNRNMTQHEIELQEKEREEKERDKEHDKERKERDPLGNLKDVEGVSVQKDFKDNASKGRKDKKIGR